MTSGKVVNFCQSEQISVCTAGNQAEQKGCDFYERARNADRCMYFIFEEYCDSLSAQLGAAGARR